jgi:aminopeptidase N
MGYRADNSHTGFGITRRLIYPKGAYVLNMLRMMMHDNRAGDQQFKPMMQDFVNTYRGKSATTEDFKAIVEKHMTPDMDMDGNHKMDWFFGEYVYGTQIPSCKLDYRFDTGPDGDVIFSFNINQANVDDSFHMLVPVYLEPDNGKMFLLGRAHMSGHTPFQQKVPLKGVKTAPKRAVINYYDDVLASSN